MTSFVCMACGGQEGRWLYRSCKDYFLGMNYRVDYAECLSCGLVQQTPVPRDVSNFYADYPIHAQRSKLQQLARRWLQRQVYFKPGENSSGLVVFDYGCGDGVYLREVKSRCKTVAGYEPGKTLAESLSKLCGCSVYSDIQQALEEMSGQVDVITAHYVMEHVVDLHTTIKTCSALLKPGGMIHIAVPNIHSWEAKLFGPFWHGLDPPRHICFPDVQTFRRLASESGLSLIHERSAVFPNTLAASIVTALFRQYRGWCFNLLVLPCWMIAMLAPSGTKVYLLRKKL